jgi:hypothetical protein
VKNNNSINLIRLLTKGMPYLVPTHEQVAVNENQPTNRLQKILVDLKTNAISFEPLPEHEVVTTRKPTHLEQLKAVDIQSRTSTDSRTILHESVFVEFIRILRYAVFNAIHPDAINFVVELGAKRSARTTVLEALYALYVRGLHDSQEEVIMQTQAILQQL